MKSKTLMAALLASAALVAPVRANGHHGGGGGNFVAGRSGAARGGGYAPSFRSMPMRSFSGNRMVYSGQRFSPGGLRSPGSTVYGSRVVRSNVGGSIAGRQFTRGNFTGGSGVSRFARSGNRAAGVRTGGNLPANWRNHVFAQRSASWHRDWNRSGDHWWHGHRCRFVNGSWVIFDLGFYPWWPWWDWYPYDYYGYGYYPYGYAYPYGYGYDDSGTYDDQNAYGQYGYGYDQSANSTVAAVQDRLAQEGYYRGQIDGVLGPETRHAIVRFQSNRGLRVNGELTTETLDALGLREYARY